MEKALLIKVISGQESPAETESSLSEMKGLIDTAGGTVSAVEIVRQKEITPSYFIGSGKASELAEKYRETVDLAVIDANLKPVQVRNLEKLLETRVVDRTQLILDIFASRAHTAEGKLQVEYAQLNYLLPRLTGRGVSMSRLGGGIGTRGPGETKLEVDTRRIKTRIQKIKADLAAVKRNRDYQRARRKAIPVPQAALVGYTNVGKTMFLNMMTGAGKLSEDKLFATLDPKIKSYILPSGYKMLFSDTVGFIKNLPPQLVSAFSATLEEVRDADIIIHMMDASDPEVASRRETVYGILESIGALEGKKIIEVFNKVDLIVEERRRVIIPRLPGIYISAKTGEGLHLLLAELEAAVEADFTEADIVVPYEKSALLELFYGEGIVLERKDTAKGIKARVKCAKKTLEKYEKMKAVK